MQAVAGRSIPILAQQTFSGSVILGASSEGSLDRAAAPAVGDRELERLCLGHLTAAARAALAVMPDAPLSPSPEEGRSTDGDESDALSGKLSLQIAADMRESHKGSNQSKSFVTCLVNAMGITPDKGIVQDLSDDNQMAMLIV